MSWSTKSTAPVKLPKLSARLACICSVGPLSSLQPLHQHTQPIQSSTQDCSQKQTSPNSLPPETNPEARDSGIEESLPTGNSEVAHTSLQLSGIVANVACNVMLQCRVAYNC